MGLETELSFCPSIEIESDLPSKAHAEAMKEGMVALKELWIASFGQLQT